MIALNNSLIRLHISNIPLFSRHTTKRTIPNTQLQLATIGRNQLDKAELRKTANTTKRMMMRRMTYVSELLSGAIKIQ